MKLTAKAVQAAISAGKSRKLYDGHSLYLHITKTGRKWRYSYTLNKIRKEYTIGDADIISLAEARKRHQAARLLVLDGLDPVQQRRKSRDEKRIETELKIARSVTVGTLIDEWFEKHEADWVKSHSSKIRSRLNNHIPEWFKQKPVVDVKPSDIVLVYKQASECSGNLVHKIRSYLRRSFEIAVANELITINPVLHPMADAAVPKKEKSKKYPHIKKAEIIGEVLVRIDQHTGNPSVSAALRLLPYIFVRSGELRNMQWREIELDNRLWRIPAQKMKSGEEHLVPLSKQAIDIIVNHYNMPGTRLVTDSKTDYVFPGRDGNKPFSDMSLGKALRSVGIPQDLLKPHGWRHTASTAINERLFLVDGKKERFSPDAVEEQLAHIKKGVRGTYDNATYLDERRRMLQAWADWLDSLRDTAIANRIDLCAKTANG